MSHLEERIHDQLLSTSRETIQRVVGVADDVAAGWTDGTTTDRDELVAGLTGGLEAENLHTPLIECLQHGIRVGGFELPATPVPAPPYLVVSSTGPLLRAGISPGRLLLSFDVFEVIRGEPTMYRRAGSAPADVLDVTLVRKPTN